jgi:ketosteroid isomerase-like protein
MKTPEIAEVMGRYVEAWERNDPEGAMALWADDIVHHVPGTDRPAQNGIEMNGDE